MANILNKITSRVFISVNVYTTTILRNASKKTDKKPLPKRKNPFIVLRAQKEDYKPIIELMWNSYYSDEPTVSSLGLRPNVCIDESVLKTLEEGVSIVSKCKFTGDIVGACVNESTSPWQPDMTDKLACSMACPKMRALLHFYAHLQRMPKLWECYKVPKIFEMSYIFTRPSDRGKGLASDMVKASRDMAADCGYKIARVDCTSHYSAKICQRLKMKQVGEIPYCAYIGEDLDPIFKTVAPHTVVKIYIDDALHEKR